MRNKVYQCAQRKVENKPALYATNSVNKSQIAYNNILITNLVQTRN